MPLVWEVKITQLLLLHFLWRSPFFMKIGRESINQAPLELMEGQSYLISLIFQILSYRGLQNNWNIRSTLIGQKPLVYCNSKPIGNWNILTLDRPNLLSIYCSNNQLGMFGEHPKSLQVTHLWLVNYKLFLCSPNILHGLLSW